MKYKIGDKVLIVSLDNDPGEIVSIHEDRYHEPIYTVKSGEFDKFLCRECEITKAVKRK